MKQLVFNFKLANDYTFTTFEMGRNLWVKLFLDPDWGKDYHLVYIHGKAGVGKSHLLKAMSIFLKKMGNKVLYLDNPENFSDLEPVEYLLLDNFSLDFKQEREFFGFFQRMMVDAKHHLVIASRLLPKQIQLADLRSRLMGELVFELLGLTEKEREICLIKWLEAKNLLVNRKIIQYLLTHCRREMGNLFKLIDNLDEQSQIKDKKLTLTFVREILLKK